METGNEFFRERKPIQDRTKIKLNEAWEINYWCRTLNCTQQELRNAVAKAGAEVEAVHEELRMMKKV